MKITDVSQKQFNPVNSTNKNNPIKSDQPHLTESYVYSKDSVRTSPLCNYTPNEVGIKSNVDIVSFRRSSSLNPPNWDVIPTEGMKVPSEDVIISQLKELIENSIRNPNPNDIKNYNYQKSKLHAQYISSVSPDRKKLHKQAMQAIKEYESKERKYVGEMTLVDLLSKQDNIKTETDKSVVAGGVLSPSISTSGGYHYDVIVGGVKLLETVNGEWTYGWTPAEKQKSDEFYRLNWLFVDEARNDLKVQG